MYKNKKTIVASIIAITNTVKLVAYPKKGTND